MLHNADEFDFVDPRSLPFVEPRSRGELPHLYKEGCSLFVTFRLWDAIVPQEELEHRRRARDVDLTKLNAHEIAELYEPRLSIGSCVLAQDRVAKVVQDAIRHFDNIRYLLFAWCIMPNHVHVVFTPSAPHQPEDVLHSWKSYTSHEINRVLLRKGRLWERESFDHLIRSAENMEGFIAYTEQNPVEAGLCARPEEWKWSSAHVRANCGAGVSPAPPGGL